MFDKYINMVRIAHGRSFVPEISEEYSKVTIE